MKIKYQAGFKYQLVEDYNCHTSIRSVEDIDTYFVRLKKTGKIDIRKGYAWDGPSGPTIDTKNFMRGSLVHDALYQLIRLGLLSVSWRKFSDNELYQICREDGMSVFRAWYVYRGVRRMGHLSTSTSAKKKVLIAP